MLHKSPLESFQRSILTAVAVLLLSSLAAADPGAASQTPKAQPESTQSQQATPTKPAAEPESSDTYQETALV